jgi:hypothetical protein
VLFKTALLGQQYPALHPELRRVLGELDAQLKGWGLPEGTITEGFRTPAEQEELYWRMFLKLGEREARMKARRKFSWHCVRCAVDFRNHDWTASDRDMIRSWMRNRCTRPEWEVLEHDAGTGLHFHLARVDFSWRRKSEKPDVA